MIASKELPNFPQDLSIQFVSSHEHYAFNERAHAAFKPKDYMLSVVQEKLTVLTEKIESLEEKLDGGDDDDDNDFDVEHVANQLSDLYELQEEMEASAERDIDKTIDDLGFTSAFLERPVSQLSCGWRYKCRLAAAFTSRPDILILDEPSFLDSKSTEWLVQKIKDIASTKGNTSIETSAMVLLISHKEALLDEVCDRILYINSSNHRLTQFHCGYQTFRTTHQADMDSAARKVDVFDTKLKSAEHSLKSLKTQLQKREGNMKKTTTQNSDKRFIKGKNKEAKQKADRSAASKIKQLKHDVEEMEEVKHQTRRELIKPLKIHGTCSSGNLVLFQQVSFSYDGQQEGQRVFQWLDAQIEATDRILLAGKNGSGKSTLMRLALGELEPTEGNITRNVQALYFPQTALIEMTLDHGDETALEYLNESKSDESSNMTETEARHHLGDFGIANTSHRSISSLSAGQRVRLWLAKQQLGGVAPSLLILDEISENLDVDTKHALLNVLNTFVGAVIVVSHDKDFCAEFKPTQVWTIQDGGRMQVDYPS